MTAYHGGKNKIGFEIASIISQIYDDSKEYINGYCEPFVGMCGVYKHIPKMLGKNVKYKAGDANTSLIMMWNKAKTGWIPKVDDTFTEQQYNKYKYDNKSTAFKGFIGHAFGFGGIYFGSFRPKYNRKQRICIDTYISNIHKISADLKQVAFTDGSYEQFSKLRNYIIYCDPPYKDTSCKYTLDDGKKTDFDYTEFINWCMLMAKNNIVLVSGGNHHMPKSFIKIWTFNTYAGSYRGHKASYCETLYYVYV